MHVSILKNKFENQYGKIKATNEISERWRLPHPQQAIVHSGVAEHRCGMEKAAGENLRCEER